MEMGEGIVKIGRSNNPKARAYQLQTGHGRDVQLFWYVWLSDHDSLHIENDIHSSLKGRPCHLRGEVYFLAPDAAVRIVKAFIDHRNIVVPPDPIAASRSGETFAPGSKWEGNANFWRADS